MGVQVKLWDPLRTRAIAERFWGNDSWRGAISSVRTSTLPLHSLSGSSVSHWHHLSVCPSMRCRTSEACYSYGHCACVVLTDCVGWNPPSCPTPQINNWHALCGHVQHVAALCYILNCLSSDVVYLVIASEKPIPPIILAPGVSVWKCLPRYSGITGFSWSTSVIVLFATAICNSSTWSRFFVVARLP